jgi:hypothetical protein
MAAQGGFTQNNQFASLATKEESDDNTAETIADMINLHMANLSTQAAATIDVHAMQTNLTLQKLPANTTQLQHQQQAIMKKMLLMTINAQHGVAVTM